MRKDKFRYCFFYKIDLLFLKCYIKIMVNKVLREIICKEYKKSVDGFRF